MPILANSKQTELRMNGTKYLSVEAASVIRVGGRPINFVESPDIDLLRKILSKIATEGSEVLEW